MRECVVCGAQLSGRRTRFCSKSCSYVQFNVDRRAREEAASAGVCRADGCGKGVRAKGLCSYHLKRDYLARGGSDGAVVAVECPWCGSRVERLASNVRRRESFCSYLCRDGMRAFRAGRNFCETAKPGPKLSRLPEGYLKRQCVKVGVPIPLASTRVQFAGGHCCRCGKQFVARYAPGGNFPKHCSVQCQRSKAKEVRRARKRDAFVAEVWRRDVFEADGFRCHICGRKVNMALSGETHPMGPTLDHVVPLANGGTHEPANCRLAHRQCNSAKSNTGDGDQMLLANFSGGTWHAA